MQVENPQLGFPSSFCCNCGATECTSEVQETRVSRLFGFGRTDTVFKLTVPVCAGCRRTLRRRPATFFSRLAVLVLITAVLFGACLAAGSTVALPLWIGYFYGGSVVLGAVLTFLFYRLRRPKAPQTSFYQPVRIRNVRLQFSGLMAGEGQVGFMKLAFSNPDYLSAFADANQEAIKAKRLSVVKA
ncbi:MAG TPA: hypothetical protein VFU13_02615 [Steroidobacteraceae bacterium]|nr:hypothetical protein [Steroidobacteraceae bacterium]